MGALAEPVAQPQFQRRSGGQGSLGSHSLRSLQQGGRPGWWRAVRHDRLSRMDPNPALRESCWRSPRVFHRRHQITPPRRRSVYRPEVSAVIAIRSNTRAIIYLTDERAGSWLRRQVGDSRFATTLATTAIRNSLNFSQLPVALLRASSPGETFGLPSRWSGHSSHLPGK